MRKMASARAPVAASLYDAQLRAVNHPRVASPRTATTTGYVLTAYGRRMLENARAKSAVKN